jgi:hypothetical protein
MTLPHLKVRKKPPFGYFAQGCEPAFIRFRIHLGHLFMINRGHTCVLYQKGDEITGLDAIYSHHKGLISSQGTVPLL